MARILAQPAKRAKEISGIQLLQNHLSLVSVAVVPALKKLLPA
jgi:hypothetical protein